MISHFLLNSRLNSLAWRSGNDFPVVRYADVLLSAAEAINEISGPTQEAITILIWSEQGQKFLPSHLLDFQKNL